MELRTLVLTPWMAPHDVIGWQAAIVLQVDAKVDVVEVYEATVSSAGNSYEGRPPLVLQVPAVVRLHRAVKMFKSGVKFSRPGVLVRDRLRCCYCNRKLTPAELNYDHVIPKKTWEGPIHERTTWENIVTSCFRCNGKKGARTPAEAGLTMHFQPRKPSPEELAGSRLLLLDINRVPDLWLPYLQHRAATA